MACIRLRRSVGDMRDMGYIFVLDSYDLQWKNSRMSKTGAHDSASNENPPVFWFSLPDLIQAGRDYFASAQTSESVPIKLPTPPQMAEAFQAYRADDTIPEGESPLTGSVPLPADCPAGRSP